MTYSIEISEYKGNPTFEILFDNENWGARYGSEDHFSFGVAKAKLIMSFIHVLKLFDQTDGKKPPYGVEVSAENPWDGYECVAINEPKFTYYDREIKKPYLELISGPIKIGMGHDKCEAILLYEDELKEFINKHV